uniref:H0721B11.4 protein n=1 Tax=Oryza sativa TaxID=4530 RepID=Q25A27_ORYSA|nr:H0721B11.4 [Oryza sativa]
MEAAPCGRVVPSPLLPFLLPALETEAAPRGRVVPSPLLPFLLPALETEATPRRRVVDGRTRDVRLQVTLRFVMWIGMLL